MKLSLSLSKIYMVEINSFDLSKMFCEESLIVPQLQQSDLKSLAFLLTPVFSHILGAC